MIAATAVRKRFGPVVAVDEVTFEVRRGDVVGFLGPNGAGKTTMMRMLTGTLEPDAGTITLDGRPLADEPTQAKRRIGYLPESNPLYVDMLVSEFLAYAASLRDLAGPGARAAFHRAVEQTGIGDVRHRPIGELSKGYRQRVGLAAAILHEPELLVLDEPTEGLDPNQRVGVRRLIRELGRDRTVLLSTHVLQEVEATCNRLLVIHQGRVAADGGVRELLDRNRGGVRYHVDVEGDGAIDALAALPGVASHQVVQHEGRLRVELVTGDATELRPVISRLVADRGWVLWELYRERATVEQLFRSVTSEAGSEETAGAPTGDALPGESNAP